MGLTLIHGNSQPHLKPRVFVVAEPNVHSALSSDLELDVYSECFDYDSFVKASLSKSISTNNAIVVVSDSLSQRVAPLEAVIALVRNNTILIPWKSSEAEIGVLNVASASPRPTANTLRRTIFQHVGMNEPPPRFDGDEYIQEPPDAHVMNFSPQTGTANATKTDQQIPNSTYDHSVSPIEWFADNQSSQNHLNTNTIEQIYDQPIENIGASAQNYVPPVQQHVTDVANEVEKQFNSTDPEVKTEADTAQTTIGVTESQITNKEVTNNEQEDSPSFLPEFFSPDDESLTPKIQKESEEQDIEVPINPTHKSNINSFWHDEQPEPEHQETQAGASSTQEWLQQAFGSPQTEIKDLSATTSSSWSAPGTVPTNHTATNNNISKQDDDFWSNPNVQSNESSPSLELQTYVSNSSDMDVYSNLEAKSQSAPSSPEVAPEVAFSPADENGSQQMWTMFDTKMEPASHGGSSFSEFPDGTDSRKAISLFEPMVLCVYSPKGGVGKTSISVNLAARLAYTTRLQVCIVDLDIAFGNVGTRLGLYNPTVRELLNESHVDGESIARNLVYDRRSGLFALLAPLRPETGTNRRKFSPAAYKKILSLLKERFDVVILDCPVELRDPLVSGFALTEASKVVMVVNNEQATLLDARRAIEAMCRPKDSQRLPGLGIEPDAVGMVVNQKVDNVGREVDDIRAILGGGDPNHPSRQIDILSVIADDRQLWVGNANMGRTVATSGENGVDSLLDNIWAKILPEEAANQFESQEFASENSSPLDEIFSRQEQIEPKKKRKRSIFKNKGEK